MVMVFNQNLLLLQIIQSLAIFDVILAFLKIIRTNYLISFIQVLSRYFIVWGPLYISTEMPSFVLSMLTLTWGLSDSVRYLYYYNPNIPIILIYLIFGFHLYYHMIMQNSKKNWFNLLLN